MVMPGLERALLVSIACLCIVAGSVWGKPRNVPGAFDYYVLVLTWMPSYCRGEGRSRRDPLCDPPHAHSFLLHGLWPKFDKGWPENCFTGKRPWVPGKVIEDMRDIMPSKNLMIHEYRVHGTCSGLTPAQYFGVARELYERIKVPPRYADVDDQQVDSPVEIERAFVGANPWLKPEMISVTCRRANVVDIRVCFGRDLFPRACGSDEDQKRLCPLEKITVPETSP
jgi:ribonuclease T2